MVNKLKQTAIRVRNGFNSVHQALPSFVISTTKVMWFSLLILMILFLLDRESAEFIYWDQ